MQLTINGQQKEIKAATVTELLAQLGIDVTQVAVERNLEIVPKSRYDRVALEEGDALEIVEFIGGG